MNRKKYINEAKSINEQVIQWRRDLHQIPEIGLKLPQTVKYVCSVLDQLSIEYDSSYIMGNGIVAHIHGTKGKSNKVIALRADMDGLPIKEETGLAFAATENMHACGHDGHIAMLLGTAKLLQSHRNEFSGIVKLIFQPGEEYPGGAKIMIEEGALNSPKPDRILGFHIGKLSPEMPDGTVGTREQALMASMDRFKILVKGKGSHAAYPEEAQDPIIAAVQIVSAIQTIVSRNIRAVDSAVISVTRIDGGYNQNIIPDDVEIEGTVRTFDDGMRTKIHHRLEEISKGIALAMNVECEVEYEYKYPALINDPVVTNEVITDLKELFGKENVISIAEPVMGGEDFAFYLREIPGTFIYLANPGYIDGEFQGHHHPKFDINEEDLYKGVAAFYDLTVNYLHEG